MVWKALAIAITVLCLFGGAYCLVASAGYVLNASHDPVGFARSEFLEGAFIAFALSVPFCSALYWLAHQFRQSPPKSPIRMAAAAVVVLGLYLWFLLIHF